MRNSSFYEFVSDESGRLCRLIVQLTGKLKFPELVKARIALLREHKKFMISRVDKDRAERTIAYQERLLSDPQRVFFSFPAKKKAKRY